MTANEIRSKLIEMPNQLAALIDDIHKSLPATDDVTPERAEWLGRLVARLEVLQQIALDTCETCDRLARHAR